MKWRCDNWAYRASLNHRITPEIPPPETRHDHRRRPADRSPSTRRCAGPARRPTGAWPTPWSPSSSDNTRRVYAAQWRFFNDWCDLVGLREALKGWGRRLARPQHQAGALTADVLSVIRLIAPRPRRSSRGFETAEQAAAWARFDLALVAVLSDAVLRRFEASSLT